MRSACAAARIGAAEDDDDDFERNLAKSPRPDGEDDDMVVLVQFITREKQLENHARVFDV